MEGFDTMTMSYYATPLNGLQAAGIGIPAPDYIHSLPVVDMQEHHSNFDTETFAG